MALMSHRNRYRVKASMILMRADHLCIGESNRIRRVPEYGHSRYLRNHKSYKKNVNE